MNQLNFSVITYKFIKQLKFSRTIYNSNRIFRDFYRFKCLLCHLLTVLTSANRTSDPSPPPPPPTLLLKKYKELERKCRLKQL